MGAKSAINSMKPETLEKKAAVRNSFLRMFLVAVSIAVQVAFMLVSVYLLQQKYTWLASGLRILALVLVIGIYSQNKTASVKILWTILILVAPIAGTMIYLIIGLNGAPRRMRTRYETIDRYLFPYLTQDPALMDRLDQEDRQIANMVRYLHGHAGYPAYGDSAVEFYPDAASGLAAQLEELQKAEKFIFMEYHAIEDAESFEPIKEVLHEKAMEGVDVRIFYDDVGSLGFINVDFVRRMENLGIQCRIFNPALPVVNLFLNNRDHRKITVIDGKVGFTGGYNLANEYFNITHPYGQWKDTGVKITGNAVRNFTVMFLEMWNAIRATDRDDEEFDRFFPVLEPEQGGERGVVLPYGDTPLDREQVGENVYLNIIHSAQRYVWFVTPYLIITDEMNSALTLAAERGVDVRIVTPGIPDKPTVYALTRSYYQRLTQADVRIYEYTPGFCHAKQCIADDKVAVCGTINLDYRSLYHHFEDGCLFYGCDAVTRMREDFEALFPVSNEVTEQYRSGQSAPRRVWNHILRLFSTFM